MRKLAFVFLFLAVLATPAFAQGSAGNGGSISNWGISGVGLAIAVGLAALGQGRVASAACEGLARNPAARPGIQLALILGLAFIESLVLFVWVMIFLKVGAASAS